MKEYLPFLLLCILTQSGLCQKSQEAVAFFDKNWNEVSSLNDATYYRTIILTSRGEYEVTDFYRSNDQKEMEAICSSVEPKLVRQGKVVWYYENGVLKEEGNYIDGEKIGMFKEYYEDKSFKSQMLHKSSKEFHCQHWTKDGRTLLVNGTGIVSQVVFKENEDKSYTYVTEFQDSLQAGVYKVSLTTNDTIYFVAEKQAEYIGGKPGLSSDLGRNLMYPKPARKKGVEGKVFIQFVVDKKGVASGAEVLKGIGTGCDEAALEAFSKLGNWNPSYYHGKPVKSIFVLPIHFKLD